MRWCFFFISSDTIRVCVGPEKTARHKKKLALFLPPPLFLGVLQGFGVS